MRGTGRTLGEGANRSLQDLARWWPFALIGPAVVAIRIPGLTPWLAFSMLIGVAAILAVQLVRRWREVVFSWETALLGGFVIWAALSLAWSPAVVQGLRFVLLVAVAYLAFLWGRVAGPPRGGSQLWWAGSVGLGITLAALIFLPDPPQLDRLNPDRILGMGAIALIVAAWYGPRRRWYTATIGLVGLATVVLSGSRMSLLVALVLLLTATGLRVPKAGRILLVVGLVVLIGLATTTTGFQQRWFESGEGTLLDLLTLDDLDTAGRFEVWPVVAEACGFTLLGHGAGAADTFSSTAHSGFPEPHNEYLRVWCDTGLVGSLLLWGFVSLAAIISVRAVRRPGRLKWAPYATIQMVTALILLSMTDNPLTTTIPFFVPAALFFGWSTSWTRSEQARSTMPKNAGGPETTDL